ncbi:MAG TPA: TIGR02996 domain-containing protein [Kofleriaceae bacterium]|jgi:uncharacterized protein (TIGR02996 family)
MAHPELEARLLEHPDDREAYMVYADHLQSLGDPRGELIALQANGRPADQFIAEHADALLGPLAEHQKTHDGRADEAFTWQLGFIRSARLSFDSNEGDEVSLDEILELLLTDPSAKFLRELIVPINMLDDGMYFGPVVQKLAEIGAPALRTLHIGEFAHAGPGGIDNEYDYEISWTSLGDASGVWRAVPRLEHLRLQVGLGGSSASGDAEKIGELVAPNLRDLEVVTGGMSAECLRAFATANVPMLESMSLWLGSDNYGATGTVDDLGALLAAAGVPKLRRLGIMNSEIADTLIEPLAGSNVLKQLTELDLRYGTLTDEGAERLLANARAFGHLAKLDLSANCLSSDTTQRVRGICANVVIDEQKGGDERYVSLSE